MVLKYLLCLLFLEAMLTYNCFCAICYYRPKRAAPSKTTQLMATVVSTGIPETTQLPKVLNPNTEILETTQFTKQTDSSAETFETTQVTTENNPSTVSLETTQVTKETGSSSLHSTTEEYELICENITTVLSTDEATTDVTTMEISDGTSASDTSVPVTEVTTGDQTEKQSSPSTTSEAFTTETELFVSTDLSTYMKTTQVTEETDTSTEIPATTKFTKETVSSTETFVTTQVTAETNPSTINFETTQVTKETNPSTVSLETTKVTKESDTSTEVPVTTKFTKESYSSTEIFVTTQFTKETNPSTVILETTQVTKETNPSTVSYEKTKVTTEKNPSTVAIDTTQVTKETNPSTVTLDKTQVTTETNSSTVTLDTTQFTTETDPSAVTLDTTQVTKEIIPITVTVDTTQVTKETNPSTVTLDTTQFSKETNPSLVSLETTQVTKESDSSTEIPATTKFTKESYSSSEIFVTTQFTKETNPSTVSLETTQVTKETNSSTVAIDTTEVTKEIIPSTVAIDTTQVTNETNPNKVTLDTTQVTTETNPSTVNIDKTQITKETNPSTVSLVTTQVTKETDTSTDILATTKFTKETGSSKATFVTTQVTKETNPSTAIFEATEVTIETGSSSLQSTTEEYELIRENITTVLNTDEAKTDLATMEISDGTSASVKTSISVTEVTTRDQTEKESSLPSSTEAFTTRTELFESTTLSTDVGTSHGTTARDATSDSVTEVTTGDQNEKGSSPPATSEAKAETESFESTKISTDVETSDATTARDTTSVAVTEMTTLDQSKKASSPPATPVGFASVTELFESTTLSTDVEISADTTASDTSVSEIEVTSRDQTEKKSSTPAISEVFTTETELSDSTTLSTDVETSDATTARDITSVAVTEMTTLDQSKKASSPPATPGGFASVTELFESTTLSTDVEVSADTTASDTSVSEIEVTSRDQTEKKSSTPAISEVFTTETELSNSTHLSTDVETSDATTARDTTSVAVTLMTTRDQSQKASSPPATPGGFASVTELFESTNLSRDVEITADSTASDTSVSEIEETSRDQTEKKSSTPAISEVFTTETELSDSTTLSTDVETSDATTARDTTSVAVTEMTTLDQSKKASSPPATPGGFASVTELFESTTLSTDVEVSADTTASDTSVSEIEVTSRDQTEKKSSTPAISEVFTTETELTNSTHLSTDVETSDATTARDTTSVAVTEMTTLDQSKKASSPPATPVGFASVTELFESTTLSTDVEISADTTASDTSVSEIEVTSRDKTEKKSSTPAISEAFTTETELSDSTTLSTDVETSDATTARDTTSVAVTLMTIRDQSQEASSPPATPGGFASITELFESTNLSRDVEITADSTASDTSVSEIEVTSRDQTEKKSSTPAISEVFTTETELSDSTTLSTDVETSDATTARDTTSVAVTEMTTLDQSKKASSPPATPGGFASVTELFKSTNLSTDVEISADSTASDTSVSEIEVTSRDQTEKKSSTPAISEVFTTETELSDSTTLSTDVETSDATTARDTTSVAVTEMTTLDQSKKASSLPATPGGFASVTELFESTTLSTDVEVSADTTASDTSVSEIEVTSRDQTEKKSSTPAISEVFTTETELSDSTTLSTDLETSDATTARDTTSVVVTEMTTLDQSKKVSSPPAISASFTTESIRSNTTTVTTNAEISPGTTTWNETSVPVTIITANPSTEQVTSPFPVSDKVTTESTTMSKVKTTENDIIPPVTTRSFSTYSSLERSLSSTTSNLIIETTRDATTPIPSTEIATTKSTIEDTTFPKTTPKFYVSSVMATRSTTNLPTTTTAPKTTRRPCPQPNLFTHGSYEIVYESSPSICPVIDINAGSSQLNCFRIYSNGYVKEGSFAFYYEPHRNYFSKWGSWILAPYMADLASGPNSMIKYSVYSKYTYNGEADVSVLKKLNEIDRYMQTKLSKFHSVWAVVITWENVRSRSLEGETWENYPGVTFQMVLVTNGERTYLLYLYKPCGMDMGVDVKAIMGYAGGGKYYIHKDSMKMNSLVNIDLNSNTGVQGEWMFDISGWYQATKKLKCLKWYATAENVPLLNYCPCTEWQAWRDFRFIYDWNTFPVTYTSLFTGRVCMYRSWFSSLWFGLTQQYNSFFNYFQWYMNDFDPYQTCCSVNLCWLYLRKRPVDFCEGYRFPFIAFTFGDPHIQTFDGFTYSFNGLGEYVFLDVYNRTTKVKLIEVQARTQLATNVNGTKVNATIFSAFAMKNFETNTTAQVEMSDSKKDLIINLDNQDLTKDFQKSPNFKKIGKISVFRKSNTSEDPKASFTFNSGIDITVSVSTGMLSASLSIPEDLQRDIQTRGLQGDIDDDPNNDLRTPNGTVLSVNSTEEEIFDNFGQLWLINQSLFTYPAGQTKDNYIDKSFRPLFLDKTTAKYKEAVKICDGETNIACIYDFIATENKALAQKTQADAKTATEELAQSKNRAPVINGEMVLEITVNKTKKWEVHVTDKDNDTVRIQIQDGKEYINVTNNGYNFTLNILIPQLTPVNISIIAIDEKNQTSGGFTLKIVLCSGCSGNGQCLKDNAEIDQQFYEQLRCTCDKGYEGKDCETDYDGCAENPCIEAKYCQDLSPEVERATNRTFNCSCPPGYLLQKDNRCLDIDECKSNATNKCESFCNNTEGSYFCSCANGYELKNKTKCVNVDECTKNLDNCEQLCNDTTPGFECYCRSGYTLQADKFSCVKDNISTACTKNCSNADGCEIDKCFCNKGFVLNSTDFCVDIDECITNPCEYKCENTKGSFYCTCPNGKKVIEKIKCEVCDSDHWGMNCSTPCDCQNNAECDPEKGCICQDGWKGTKCSEDINECDNVNNCTNIQTCINKKGSYDCECIAGYRKEGNGCVDINECQEDKPCTDLCENIKGSFFCKCHQGYSSPNEQNCTDINECQENLSGCEQVCNNNEGSYTCNCFEGYKLNDDRQTCSLIQQSEACKDANCTKNQFCKYSNGTGQCLCKNGYEFDNTTKTCKWIDLCKSNPCKNGTCLSNSSKITCNCYTGYYQEVNSCKPCDSAHWGDNCQKLCECIHGICNNVIGCVCREGYTGLTCDKKINYCVNHTCDATSNCKSLATNYTCECKDGYYNTTPSIGNCTEFIQTTTTTTKTATTATATTTTPTTSQTWTTFKASTKMASSVIPTKQVISSSATTATPIETESVAVSSASGTTATPAITNKISSETVNTTDTITTPTVPSTEPFVFETTIILNKTFPKDKKKQEELKVELKITLTEEFKSVPGFIRVIINKISAGSVLVNYSIVSKENSDSSLNEKLDIIKKNGLKVFNETVNVLSIKSFVCTKGCDPVDDKTYLAIGLGIGIPLLVIIILIIVKLIWFRRKNAFATQRLDHSNIYNTQESFKSLSVFQGKRLRINDDFAGDLRTNTWEDETYNSAAPGYYLRAMLERQGSFRLNRPKLY